MCKANRIISPTLGGGPFIKALMQAQKSALLIGRNDARIKHLKEYALTCIKVQATSNASCDYYMPRASALKRCGLEPDDAANEGGTSSDEDQPVLLQAQTSCR